MKIVMIHGQSHKGSTWHIANILAGKAGGEVQEFFLPKDFGEFCNGCTACFIKSEKRCPHFSKLEAITKALDEADVIILASPVYAYHASGAMKALLDHYAYRWMSHRPDPGMFSKQAVCISTAAGAGTKSAIKDMADSTFFWGCAKTYKLGFAAAATCWDEVSPKKKKKIDKKTAEIANKILKNENRVKPGLKTRVFFQIMKLMQKDGWNPADKEYWKSQGWLSGRKPWQSSETEKQIKA